MALTVAVPMVLWFTPIVQPMKPALARPQRNAVLKRMSWLRPAISETRSCV
jgi:hypothetical protein